MWSLVSNHPWTMNLDTALLSKYTTNRLLACHYVTSAFCSASRYISLTTCCLLTVSYLLSTNSDIVEAINILYFYMVLAAIFSFAEFLLNTIA